MTTPLPRTVHYAFYSDDKLKPFCGAAETSSVSIVIKRVTCEACLAKAKDPTRKQKG